MKIIQVINVKWYNATAWYAINLSKCLADAGHDCLVVGIEGSLPIAKAKQFGLATYEITLNSNILQDSFRYFREIDEICKSFQPEIVNCHYGESFLFWAFKKYKYNYKLVRTRGDQRLPAKNFINSFLYKYISDIIISTNTRMTNHFKTIGVNPAKLHTILGGVDIDVFFPDQNAREIMRQKHGFEKNDVVIGLIGRLDPIKGFYQAVKCFANICKQDTQNLENKTLAKLHLFIFGLDCKYTLADLYTYGLEQGIPVEQLHIIGRIEHMREAMTMLDAGLISSVGSEAIARVAFEMIACNVPIIGSNVGVMPDILEKEYLYDVGDYNKLQDLFIKLKDFDYRENLRKKCYSRLHENQNNLENTNGWTFDSFIKKTLKIYKSL